MEVKHLPVALDRCIELLTPSIANSKNPVIVDATLGLGGHSFELLSRFPQLKIIGIDRDDTALNFAKSRLEKFSGRVTFNQAIFSAFSEILKLNHLEKIDGAIFDLGVSSMQLDSSDRGFSYAKAAPLDMRMDQSKGITAQEVINTYEKSDLIRILREYGDRKSTRLNSSHSQQSRMPSSA